MQMVLYTIPDCQECEEILRWIDEKGNSVPTKELKKIDDVWMEQDEDGYRAFNTDVRGFPALKLGDQNATFLVGTDGIKKYIDKGFLHEIRTCPYMQKPCIEKECEKFVVMKTGNVYEGGCSDYMYTKLLTSLIQQQKRG